MVDACSRGKRDNGRIAALAVSKNVVDVTFWITNEHFDFLRPLGLRLWLGFLKTKPTSFFVTLSAVFFALIPRLAYNINQFII